MFVVCGKEILSKREPVFEWLILSLWSNVVHFLGQVLCLLCAGRKVYKVKDQFLIWIVVIHKLPGFKL